MQNSCYLNNKKYSTPDEITFELKNTDKRSPKNKKANQ